MTETRLELTVDGLPQSVLVEPGRTLLRVLREDLGRFVVTSGWGLLELKPVSITLEDVFLRLTQEESDKGEGDRPIVEEVRS